MRLKRHIFCPDSIQIKKQSFSLYQHSNRDWILFNLTIIAFKIIRELNQRKADLNDNPDSVRILPCFPQILFIIQLDRKLTDRPKNQKFI